MDTQGLPSALLKCAAVTLTVGVLLASKPFCHGTFFVCHRMLFAFLILRKKNRRPGFDRGSLFLSLFIYHTIVQSTCSHIITFVEQTCCKICRFFCGASFYLLVWMINVIKFPSHIEITLVAFCLNTVSSQWLCPINESRPGLETGRSLPLDLTRLGGTTKSNAPIHFAVHQRAFNGKPIPRRGKPTDLLQK